MIRRFCNECRTITEWAHAEHSPHLLRCKECKALIHRYDKRRKAKRTGES